MDGVILLHGLGLHALAMTPLAWRIRKAGFQTLLLTYPSLTRNIENCAEFLDAAITRFAGQLDGQLHVVTHSMGGLVARAYLARHRPRNLGRVVMMAPPFGGSEIADLLRDNPLYRRVIGPAGQQLTTDAQLDALLGAIDYPLGIIAGDRSITPFSVVKRPHDGKVSVASTRLAGASDHLVLPVPHALMIVDPRVAAQVLCFLRDGHFRRE